MSAVLLQPPVLALLLLLGQLLLSPYPTIAATSSLFFVLPAQLLY
jgi:hypothetical protein